MQAPTTMKQPTPELLAELKAYVFVPRVFYVLRRTDIDEIFYVGCTIRNLKVRLRGHRNHKTAITGRYIKMYPVVIEPFYTQKEGEDWQELEVRFIEKFKSDGHPLVNICLGGLGLLGVPVSEKNKKAISERGSIPVYLKNIATNDVVKFKSATEAALFVGATQSAITGAIKSHGNIKGHLVSFNRVFSQTELSKKYRKPITCTFQSGDIKVFTSANSAANELNMDAGFIRKCANGIYKQYKGYKFSLTE